MHLSPVPRCAALAALAVSSVLLAAGLIGYVGVPAFIAAKVSQQICLRANSSTLSQWTDVPVPIHFSVFLFNITNPDEFAAGGKPILQQLGPYVYLQKRHKEILHMDNDVVSYVDRKLHYFQPALSNGSLDDVVCALNVPLVTVAKLVTNTAQRPLLQPIIEGLVDKYSETLVVRRRVGEMLFEGYEVPMLAKLARLAAVFLPGASRVTHNTKRFGLLVGKNDSADTHFTVGTGTGRVPFATIFDWNNRTLLNFWNGDLCNRINGTDGGQFPPFVRSDRRLYVFSTDLCRSIYFEYERPSSVRNVYTKRFTVPPSVFASADEREENRCFCESPGRCRLAGVVSLSACRQGAPIVLSAPHFYLGDDRLVEDVEGLRPQKNAHETFLDIQMMTGIVMRAAKRLQINIDLQQDDLIYHLKNLTNRIVPMAWIEESMEATEAMSSALEKRLVAPQRTGAAVSSGAAIGGALGLIAALFVLRVHQTSSSRSAKLEQIK